MHRHNEVGFQAQARARRDARASGYFFGLKGSGGFRRPLGSLKTARLAKLILVLGLDPGVA